MLRLHCLSVNMRKILMIALLLSIFVLCGGFEAHCASGLSAGEVYSVLCEELLTDETPYSITQNLDLNTAQLLSRIGAAEDVSITWHSSAPQAIETNGAVHRDRYRNVKAVITANIPNGGEVLKKEFEFTVLSEQNEVYFSENFNYNAPNGTRLTAVEGITVNSSAYSSSIRGNGWAFGNSSVLSSSPVGAMDGVLDIENGNHALLLSRSNGNDLQQDYLRYSFDELPTDSIVWEADVKVKNSSLPQVYLFEIYGVYMQGSNKQRVRVADFSMRFSQSGGRLGVGFWAPDASSPELDLMSCSELAADSLIHLEARLSGEAQAWDLYVNGEKINAEPLPFYERDKGGAYKGQLLYFSDFQIGTYRGYTDGELRIDNISVHSDASKISENARAYELAEQLTFNEICGENASEDLICSDLLLPSVIDEFSLNWISSNKDAVSHSGKYVNTSSDDIAVSLKAQICKGGEVLAEKEFVLTSLAAEGYRNINRVLQKIRFEIFSDEPQNAVTRNLNLSQSCVEAGNVVLTFKSSNQASLKNDGTVIRKSDDCSVELEITASENNLSKTKIIPVNVLGKNKEVYYSENFYNTAPLGSGLSEISGWSNTSDSTGFLTEMFYNGEEHCLKSYRETASDADYNFVKLSLNSRCSTTFDFAAEMKFLCDTAEDLNAPAPIYVLQVMGVYKSGEHKLAELRFGYDVNGIRFQNEDGTLSTELNYLPPLNRWFDIHLSFDVLAQGVDIYIDGIKRNRDSIPFYYSDENENFISVSSVMYNSYRTIPGLGIMTDDVSVVGKTGLHHNLVLYENGNRLQNADELNYYPDCEASATIYISNGSAEQKSASAYLSVYENGALAAVYKNDEALVLEAGETERVSFNDIYVGDGAEEISVKCFLWERDGVQPQDKAEVMSRRESVIYNPEYFIGSNGREITYIDLSGNKAYKGYFSAQCWSADGKKLFLQSENHDIYMYDTDTEKLQFISKSNEFYSLTATRSGSLFFVNGANEIVRMDTETMRRERIAELPPEVMGSPTLLTVTADEKKLAAVWSEDSVNFPNDGKKYRRFPVLDIDSGIWYTENHVYGFSDVPPYNTYINPVYSNLLLFNHANTANDERIWIFDTDTGKAQNIYRQKQYNEQYSGESVSHECWTFDGERLALAVNNIGSRQIGKNGVMTISKDGKDRRYINSEYGYLHLGASPVSERWVVGDTGYGNGMYSNIVLVDCYSGEAHHIATVRQTGEDSVAHCHPAFTPDGMSVYFGMYNEDYTSCGIGVVDVSDIINNAPERDIIPLSDNCRTESVFGFEYYLSNIVHNGRPAWELSSNGYMNVNYLGAECENTSATIYIDYYTEDADKIVVNYYQWTEGETNKLTPVTVTVPVGERGVWQTAVIEIDNINLEGMGELSADFSISSDGGALAVSGVNVES